MARLSNDITDRAPDNFFGDYIFAMNLKWRCRNDDAATLAMHTVVQKTAQTKIW
jgi:hypothetical protein